MDLNNINISDLKEKILQIADKKTLIKFGIGFGSIILFLIIYYAILNPIVKTKKVMLDDMNLKQSEISTFNNEIITFKARIKKIEPEFKKNSTLFHSKEEVEGLYLSLSKYAGVNGLVISKISKQKPKPILKDGVNNDTPDKLNKKNVSYYKIPVNYEIKGNFLGYIKFKRELAKSNKMLNFDKETIKILQSDKTGAILATGVLTIVGLTDEFF
jgi:Tfp pilus assembly protein PilO